MRTCSICGVPKDDSEYFKSVGRQCKRCMADRSRARYHTRYREGRLADRRQKDLARKTFPTTGTEAQRAYAAGLVDGEGCIHLARRGGKQGQYAVPHQNGQHTIVVYLNNTAKPMIDFLQSLWGGYVNIVPANEEKNSRAQWHWGVSANKALRFLDDIFPFLIVKRRQAQLARRFQRYVQVTGRERTEKIYKLQCRFFDEMRVLNQRGLRALPPSHDPIGVLAG